MRNQLLPIGAVLLLAAVAATPDCVGAQSERSNREPDWRAQGTPRARATTLMGKEVKNMRGDTLGEIRDLVVDLRAGSAPFAIVLLNGTQTRVAVPLEQLRPSLPDQGLTLSATREQLENATRESARSWDRFRQEPWAKDVDGFFGQPPRSAMGELEPDREYTRRAAESTRRGSAEPRNTELALEEHREYRDRGPQQGQGAYDLMHMDDRQLEQRVRARLVREGYATARKRIEVYASEGVVTLSGPVGSESASLRLERFVEGLPGVRRVVNQLALP